MDQQKKFLLHYTLIFLCVFLIACHNDKGAPQPVIKIVTNPENMDEQSAESIEQVLQYAVNNAGKIDDSTKIILSLLVRRFYNENNFKAVWSKKEKWQPLADSLLKFINDAELFGLFPKDYNAKKIWALKTTLDTDSVQHMNAVLWAKADVLLTEAALRIFKDLKFGRLTADSTYFFNDTGKTASFTVHSLQQLLGSAQLSAAIHTAEPAHKGYNNLKSGIKKFADSMDRNVYTYVLYPYKKEDEKDSLLFIKALQKRLAESKCIDVTGKLPDSAQLNTAVKKYQKIKGVKQDGIVSAALIKIMNGNDVERFYRIAITLDRYKLLPDSLPQKYVWVNLPGYYLQLWDNDTLALESKIICGKPATPTPILKGSISNMVVYPTWTVPTSIIAKQYLPKLKNNPNYLSRIGLKLVDSKGETVNPFSVNWSKYTKGIPYKVMQNSGDDNALGVFKFNFENPYAVYLHDTNQRYLFKNTSRAFSHGCVRVQEWQALATYIARNDSMNLAPGDSLRYTADSISNWLAEKKTRRINVKNPLPLFINYFTCEGKDGKIKFYDDIYGGDKALREKYFSIR